MSLRTKIMPRGWNLEIQFLQIPIDNIDNAARYEIRLERSIDATSASSAGCGLPSVGATKAPDMTFKNCIRSAWSAQPKTSWRVGINAAYDSPVNVGEGATASYDCPQREIRRFHASVADYQIDGQTVFQHVFALRQRVFKSDTQFAVPVSLELHAHRVGDDVVARHSR